MQNHCPHTFWGTGKPSGLYGFCNCGSQSNIDHQRQNILQLSRLRPSASSTVTAPKFVSAGRERTLQCLSRFWIGCHNYAIYITPRVSLCPKSYADSGSASSGKANRSVRVHLTESAEVPPKLKLPGMNHTSVSPHDHHDPIMTTPSPRDFLARVEKLQEQMEENSRRLKSVEENIAKRPAYLPLSGALSHQQSTYRSINQILLDQFSAVLSHVPNLGRVFATSGYRQTGEHAWTKMGSVLDWGLIRVPADLTVKNKMSIQDFSAYSTIGPFEQSLMLS